MEISQLFENIIQFIVPAAIVFFTAYFFIRKFFDAEERRRYYELKASNQKVALPIRLQAYERLTLLLERLSINSLILRTKKPGMTSAELQGALLSEIRVEFDHNLSQQLYITSHAWSMVVNAKEEIVKLINLSASKLPPNASSMDLSKVIFEKSMSMDKSPIQLAIQYLKKEAQELF